MVSVIDVLTPGYAPPQPIDYAGVGKKVDAAIRRDFPNAAIILRAISLADHRIPLDDVVFRIMDAGTDHYDPSRPKNPRYYLDAAGDFFGEKFHTKHSRQMAEHALRKFHDVPLKRRAPPKRVDLLLVYDPLLIETVGYYTSGSLRPDELFRFKDPKNRPDALKGIIRILP